MKFLCLSCDEVMAFAERQLPGDGTLTAIFTCPACKREMALLTNPMETQLVTSLGVEIGGRTVPQQPMQQTRMGLDSPLEEAFEAPVSRDLGRGGDRAPRESAQLRSRNGQTHLCRLCHGARDPRDHPRGHGSGA